MAAGSVRRLAGDFGERMMREKKKAEIGRSTPSAATPGQGRQNATERGSRRWPPRVSCYIAGLCRSKELGRFQLGQQLGRNTECQILAQVIAVGIDGVNDEVVGGVQFPDPVDFSQIGCNLEDQLACRFV